MFNVILKLRKSSQTHLVKVDWIFCFEGKYFILRYLRNFTRNVLCKVDKKSHMQIQVEYNKWLSKFANLGLITVRPCIGQYSIIFYVGYLLLLPECMSEWKWSGRSTNVNDFGIAGNFHFMKKL